MPEYLGFEFTEEEARQYIGIGILWGLLTFSVGITTVDFFRKYSIKIKVFIVEKDPQN
jgi:hypothetical protein|tara:strand:- start:392 stop:565 length:174 start_codon:yes stop_codon:yes gene_type:complete